MTGKESGGSHAPTEKKSLQYISGYGNELESEARKGAIPHTTTPKVCPFGLYAEQLSGTAFTVPRHKQRRSWLYRMKPACQHTPFKPYPKESLIRADFGQGRINPNQIRWKAFQLPSQEEKIDFVDGIKTLGGAGSAELKSGLAIHIYTANVSMTNRAMCNSDGDLLVVPQQGSVVVVTEFGILEARPGEIFILPRGVRFKVQLKGRESARGYICEIFAGHFEIPDLGPIGANGLAHARDFKIPTAHFEAQNQEYEIIYKFLGKLFECSQDHSPFDVVGWRGNYYPSKYCLDDFVTVNSVSIDHLDPSIFTVLTAQSSDPGVAIADFVIFPPRYAVQRNTFRPPYYHRNCMTEFMGNIRGRYEAKPDGFVPGSASLHSCMVGHGPDSETFEKASSGTDDPVWMGSDNLAFMFESTYMIRLTDWAESAPRDEGYYKCWEGLKDHFTPAAGI